MRLDQALVARKLCESRTEAQELIGEGYVYVDGVVVTKQNKQVHESEHIIVTGKRKFVSRGGQKLEGGLMHVFTTQEYAMNHLKGKSAIDIGSSTGGFTDCLLYYGVHAVTAVDVGSMQLHPRLRSDKRITLFENTDIRNFTHEKFFSVVVADLSFTSLEKLLPSILKCGTMKSTYFLLIKPQFEVGKGNTKKGVVKDTEQVKLVLKRYKHLSQEYGLQEVDIFPCNIQGGDGNQEYFLYGVR